MLKGGGCNNASAVISAVGLASVLSVKATGLCLRYRECPLLRSAAAEVYVLLLLDMMT